MVRYILWLAFQEGEAPKLHNNTRTQRARTIPYNSISSPPCFLTKRGGLSRSRFPPYMKYGGFDLLALKTDWIRHNFHTFPVKHCTTDTYFVPRSNLYRILLVPLCTTVLVPGTGTVCTTYIYQLLLYHVSTRTRYELPARTGGTSTGTTVFARDCTSTVARTD